jgi:hypothetical protein
VGNTFPTPQITIASYLQKKYPTSLRLMRLYIKHLGSCSPHSTPLGMSETPREKSRGVSFCSSIHQSEPGVERPGIESHARPNRVVQRTFHQLGEDVVSNRQAYTAEHIWYRQYRS